MSRRTSAGDQTTGARRATVIGVEVDGARVTAVQVAGTRALAARVVDGQSATDALDRALAGTPAGARVTIMVAGEAQASARMSVPEPPADRAQLAAAVAEHVRTTRGADRGLLNANVSLTGAFRAPSGVGLRWTGLVVASATGRLRAVYDTARQHTTGPVHLIATPNADATAGTLVVALRETNSSVTLSYDGVPVATAQLSAGGLGVVEAALGSGDSVGQQRTLEALAHGGVRDPLAAVELDRWLREVLDELTATISAWREDGLAVPDVVFLYGRAARAASIDLLLGDYGLRRAATPPAIASGLLDIPDADRSHVLGAYLAALSDVADIAAFPDPTRERAAARRARSTRRRRRVGAWAGAAAVLALAATGPHLLALGAQQIDQGNARELATAAATNLGVDSATVNRAADALAATQAATSTLDAAAIADVAALAPPGALLTSLLAEPAGERTAVHVTADLSAGVPLPDLLTPWRDAGFTITSMTTHPSAAVSIELLR